MESDEAGPGMSACTLVTQYVTIKIKLAVREVEKRYESVRYDRILAVGTDRSSMLKRSIPWKYLWPAVIVFPCWGAPVNHVDFPA